MKPDYFIISFARNDALIISHVYIKDDKYIFIMLENYFAIENKLSVYDSQMNPVSGEEIIDAVLDIITAFAKGR